MASISGHHLLVHLSSVHFPCRVITHVSMLIEQVTQMNTRNALIRHAERLQPGQFRMFLFLSNLIYSNI